jgi:hypothetical protein
MGRRCYAEDMEKAKRFVAPVIVLAVTATVFALSLARL